MNKTSKWILGIAASPFVLFLLLTLLLYCPPVQRWAVGIATQYASEQTGMEVSIDDVHLKFPLDLELGGVKALQRNDSLPQVKDTIINARSMICEVQLCPLFHKNVQIDIMQMDDVILNTSSFISDCRVKGRFCRLMLNSHGIDLKNDTLMLNKVMLDGADLDICLSDTAKKDTTKTQIDWRIRFGDLSVKDSRMLVHMPGDTLNVGAEIQSLTARNGDINLLDGIYRINAVDLNNSRVKYDNRFATKTKGLDPNHLDVNRLNLGLDSLYIYQSDVRLKIRACNAIEKCGFNISSLTTNFRLDSTTVRIDDFDLHTAYDEALPTHLTADVALDLNFLDKTNPGQLSASIDGQIGKHDVMLLAGNYLPANLVRRWPNAQTTLSGMVTGNMKRCQLSDVRLLVPTIGSAIVTGTAYNLDNQKAMRCDAQLSVNAAAGNGSASGKASFNMRGMVYSAKLNVKNLNIRHFLPSYPLGRFTGNVSVNGKGTDLMSHSTKIDVAADINRFNYDKYDLSGATLKARIANGLIHADVKTVASIMNANLVVDGKVSKRNIDATVNADVKNIDFYALRLTKKPLSLSVKGAFDLMTNLKDDYSLRGRIDNICITDTARQFTPNDIVLDMFTRRDSTHVDVRCGDFMLNGDFGTGYKRVLSFGNDIMKEIGRQLNDRIIDEMALRSKFRNGKLRLSSGRDNPVARMIGMYGYSFDNLDVDVAISRATGINGYVRIDTLSTGKMQFDDIDLELNGDAETMGYALRVANDKNNPNFCFTANAVGELQPNGTSLSLSVDDMHGKRGLDVDLLAIMEQDNIRLSIANDKPILGYTPFDINDDNYVRLSRDMRVSADVRLRSKEGTGIQIYTEDDNDDVLQDITLSVNMLDLDRLTSALPFMPSIGGMLNGDFHFIMEEKQMSISTDSDITNLEYEGYPMGNVSTQLVYMPLDDGSHYIDGVLFKEGNEVATINGRYYFEGDDMIDAELQLVDMPMDMINGFIPDQIMGMKGTGVGSLRIKGYVSSPSINGTVDLSAVNLISVPYGVNLKMDNKKLNIVNSNIVFENYRLTASNGSPLTVNGYFDFSDMGNMMTNLHVKGDNVQIIDAKETRKSEAYGKAFVNFYGVIQGALSSLNVKAQLDVLPSTNLYYILRDSPITTDNRLKELVTFTDFSAEQMPVVQLPTVNGMNMSMNINVHDGSHIVCWLNTNHTNYLDIYGNGELRFTYIRDKMKMTGRYTLSEGEMKYSLPVIPLKTFNISKDSYIEFTGDVMNPSLHITATENNRATASVDGQDVAVDFVCGVVLSKTLKDMGLEFIISAPENLSLTDYLNILSKEERAKLAVGMLTTGMYLDNNNSNITMNTALSSFLQQEINNIAGSALKTLDLSLGLENSTTPDGNMRMDYSFKFAKRFWHNRVSVSIGGKISTGSQSAGKTPSFFDNVEVQYRLSDTSNQYLQLFYKHDVYDYLEGYQDHFGAGYMWKRKFQHLSDLFPKKQPLKPTADSDTIQSDTISVHDNP